MNRSILDIFRIDRLGKGIFVKVLFTLALMAGVSVYFFPLGDPDYSAIVSWFTGLMSDASLISDFSLADMPVTSGNIIYALHVLFSDFFILFCGFIYTGAYIRQYRKEHGRDDPGDSGYLIPPRFLAPASLGTIIGRLIVLFLGLSIVLLPGLFVVFYLFLIFIAVLPCIGMYPACYLSGDAGFFSSFKEMVRVTKGYYLINARNISTILVLYFVGDMINSFLMSNWAFVAYVTGPLIDVFLALSYGRYIGMVYCVMREVPGGLHIRNHAS